MSAAPCGAGFLALGPRRGGAGRHALWRRARLVSLEQLERGAHGLVALRQREARLRILEIEGLFIQLEDLVRLDAAALDGTPGGREVPRGGELDGATGG